MEDRPYVVCSVATSVDGYIDDATLSRLMLSGDADFDRVDEVRASVDAILVGAETIRRDDPQLLVRSPDRIAERAAGGMPGSPMKVTVTGRGDLDPGARFFTAGDVHRIVYAPDGVTAPLTERVGDRAQVVAAGDPVSLPRVLADLAARGVSRLLVEGGTSMHTQFLAANLVDELHLSIAPIFVGDGRAPRFVTDAVFPHGADHRMTLIDAAPVGDCVLIRYRLGRDGTHG